MNVAVAKTQPKPKQFPETDVKPLAQVQLNVEADDGQIQVDGTLTIDSVASENYANNLNANNIAVQ